MMVEGARWRAATDVTHKASVRVAAVIEIGVVLASHIALVLEPYRYAMMPA